MAKKIDVQYTHDNQVVRITLNSPKGNVLDAVMMDDIRKTLEELKDQPQVKLIQFTGAGGHFCFGASVPEHTKDKAPQMLKQFHGLFYTLADLAIPTAALVSGQCLGGGMELALMCNFMFLDQTARLGQPEISLAVFAPPASVILPMKIGQARADDLLLTGRIIKPDVALQMGLATEVYDDRDAMMSGVDGWLEKQILPKSASSLKFANKAARSQFNKILKKRLAKLEKFYIDDLMESCDANEGIGSFLERRKPEWKNR
ncbi:MAG: enoyl-CoA hydratase-related protein [candidate division Zixibacteria bacterium]